MNENHTLTTDITKAGLFGLLRKIVVTFTDNTDAENPLVFVATRTVPEPKIGEANRQCLVEIKAMRDAARMIGFGSN